VGARAVVVAQAFFGCLKCRPTMSVNGSNDTFALDRTPYRSLTVTSRGSMYHLWFFSIL